jgi:ATP-dependent Clp protease ATP-binding subunit ClpC
LLQKADDAVREIALTYVVRYSPDDPTSYKNWRPPVIPNTIVRRYREEPPLIRDAGRKWRTGRLDLVLGGEFDLLQAGQR